MANLGYVFRRLLDMNYKAMWNMVSYLHKKTGKSRLWLLRDMQRCAVNYGAGYMDYDLFEMYNLTPEQRDTYLTRGRNNALVKRYNDMTYGKYFTDKAEFNRRFNDYIHRQWILMEQDNKEQVLAFLRSHEVFIAKPLDGCCGRGVEKLKVADFGDAEGCYAHLLSLGVQYELEELLITSDVGVDTTVKIIRKIEERVARDKYLNAEELYSMLYDEIALLMEQAEGSAENFGLDAKEGEPYVAMVVGVNGAGKTTTIGKLAAQLVRAGKKVYIGAADTFRAAAIDQLGVWAERAGATMIRQEMGSDPASVAFDTLKSAVANGADVVLIDTAGRLHNKVGLMNELTKIRNVMSKVIPNAPHEVMLVLDGSTGQNAFEQARQFTQATQVTSLTITKLDGTAKGGVVIGISDQFHIPVRYIGIGEGIDQLRMFNRHDFVNALFGEGK